jgi:hypothetical protein
MAALPLCHTVAYRDPRATGIGKKHAPYCQSQGCSGTENMIKRIINVSYTRGNDLSGSLEGAAALADF